MILLDRQQLHYERSDKVLMALEKFNRTSCSQHETQHSEREPLAEFQQWTKHPTLSLDYIFQGFMLCHCHNLFIVWLGRLFSRPFSTPPFGAAFLSPLPLLLFCTHQPLLFLSAPLLSPPTFKVTSTHLIFLFLPLDTFIFSLTSVGPHGFFSIPPSPPPLSLTHT